MNTFSSDVNDTEPDYILNRLIRLIRLIGLVGVKGKALPLHQFIPLTATQWQD
jgi:hypothetical protein